MPKLSVTIITRNEASNITQAIQSVAWSDEVLVVDCGSTDRTVTTAEQLGARVLHREWRGFGEQKNFAADQAVHDWILSLDADERVSEPLASELRAVLASDPPHVAYRIPRISWYLGQPVRTTDWYPNLQLRLYNRRHGRWNTRRVHESVEVTGSIGRLVQPLEHRPYRDVAHHLETMNRYTTLAAQEMYDEGRRSGIGALLTMPAAAFLRNFVLKRGFMQGSTGFVISSLNTYYVFLKFVKLWELQRRS